MGASYIHECDKCGYTFHTSGPWEFYRDREGKLKDYGPLQDQVKQKY